MDKLKKLLEEACPGVDFDGDALVDEEILDSLDIVTIVNELMDAYEVEITVDDLMPENFNSVRAIYDMLERKKG